MSYPTELDTDDIRELAAYIERRYPTEEIRIHDTETIHFGYWDKSHRSVSAVLLDHIQQAGYRVLNAGVATVPRRATRRAWMECRRDEADENEIVTVSCNHCKLKYAPEEARKIVIFGSGDVRYTCPRCGHGTDTSGRTFVPDLPLDLSNGVSTDQSEVDGSADRCRQSGESDRPYEGPPIPDEE